MDGNSIGPVEEFTYLGSIQSSIEYSHSGLEYIRCIGLGASIMKRLGCIWSQSKLNVLTKLKIYSMCALPILLCDSMRLGPSNKLIGIDWILFMYGANDASGMTVSNDEVLHCTSLFDISCIIRK